MFQIPTDACPEGGFGGFATDSFKELAATAPVRAVACCKEWHRPALACIAWARLRCQCARKPATGADVRRPRLLPAPAPPRVQSGEFAWQLPTEPGDYWVTSQAGQDCINGALACSLPTPAGAAHPLPPPRCCPSLPRCAPAGDSKPTPGLACSSCFCRHEGSDPSHGGRHASEECGSRHAAAAGSSGGGGGGGAGAAGGPGAVSMRLATASVHTNLQR